MTFHCTSSAGWPWEPHDINLHLSSHLFTANAALADAVAGLHNLVIIRFDDADDVTLNVLSRMKSRPRYVDVEILEYRYGDNDVIPRFGPFIRGRHHFLENFTESLVELKLSGYPDIVATLEPDTVWSCVKHLHLCGEMNSLSTVARAFPRVRILELDGWIPGTAVAPNQWSDLDFVRTKQTLQLSCPIRRLEFEDYLSPISRMGPGDFWDPITVRLVQDASPVVLSCYLRGAMSRTVLLSLESLRFLQIRIDDSLGGADDIESWIISRVSMLSTIPLVGLSVTIYSSRNFRESSLSKNAGMMAVRIPTLKYVGFKSSELSEWQSVGITSSELSEWRLGRMSFWYRVISRVEDGEVQLELLSEQQGEILEQELLDTPRT